MIYREKIPKRAIALLFAAVISWTCAGILFNQRVSDWSVSISYQYNLMKINLLKCSKCKKTSILCEKKNNPDVKIYT